MTADGESIRQNPEISKAEAKLREALENVSSTAIDAVKEVTQNFTDHVEKNVLHVKNSIVDGIREIKEELDISDVIRKNPWESVVTAAVGGSILSYLMLRSPKIWGAAGFVFKKEAAILQVIFFAADLYLKKKNAASSQQSITVHN